MNYESFYYVDSFLNLKPYTLVPRSFSGRSSTSPTSWYGLRSGYLKLLSHGPNSAGSHLIKCEHTHKSVRMMQETNLKQPPPKERLTSDKSGMPWTLRLFFFVSQGLLMTSHVQTICYRFFLKKKCQCNEQRLKDNPEHHT